MDTRFNFTLSTGQDAWLRRKAFEQRVSKADIVRGLIDRAMNENFSTDGINPLPGLRNDFVERWVSPAMMLLIRPRAPKPDELALFHQHATDAGFRPGPAVLWGKEHFPGYYYRPISQLKQRDWKAVAWFEREAQQRNEMGGLEELANVVHTIESDNYTAELNTGREWNMTIYRNGVEIDTLTLP